MASTSERSESEVPYKRLKHDTDDNNGKNNGTESEFGAFSTTVQNHLDVCEGTSTDSGFNECSSFNTDSRTCDVSNTLKKITSDSQLIERIFAMRGIIDEKLWLELTCQLFKPPPRQRLLHISRFVDVIRLIKSSRKIMVLTGAGVSVSCGIPDFRSRDGIYARLAQDFPDLPDPHAMFDSGYFRQDPRPFFKFAKEIYPGRFLPSTSHKFIKALETHGRLLRNYTQNIDTLERAAGINRVIECHGSFAQATCTRCHFTVDAEQIRADIFEQRIPICKNCNPNAVSVSASDENINFTELVENGIMKPNITFFGEDLPSKFYKCIQVDRVACDLLLVIGSSLKVRPVAEVPAYLPPNIPQILINRERLPHCTFDVELLGDSDVIVNQICHRLGESWSDVTWQPPLKRTKQLNRPTASQMPMNNQIPSTNTSPHPYSNNYDISTSSSNQYLNLDNVQERCNNLMYEHHLLFDKEASSNSMTDEITTLPSESEESSSCVESDLCSLVSPPLLSPTHSTITKELLNNYSPSYDASSIDDGTTASYDSEFSTTCTQQEFETKSFQELINTDTLNFKNTTLSSSSSSSADDTICETKSERHNSIDSGINDDLDYSHLRINVSEFLPDNTFYFRPPNKYIFPGAEVKLRCKYLRFK